MKKNKFIKFYDKYAPAVYRFVCVKVNSQQEAEDITSEAFLKMWKEICQSENKIKNNRAFVYKLANNLVIDFYRKKNNSEIKKDPQEDNELKKIQDSNNLENDLIINSEIEQVKQALARFKKEHQDIILWKYLGGLSYKEISQILDKPEKNIRVMAHRTLKKLKQKM